MKKIGVIGAGSWGTALALALARTGHSVKIWDLDSELIDIMTEKRENRKYLPNVKLEDNIEVMHNMADALDSVDIVLFSVPAQHFRDALTKALSYIDDDMVVVNVAKGIEQTTLMRLSEVAYSMKPGIKYVVLSGPSHAEEVGRNLPTMVTVVSKDENLAKEIQKVFNSNTLRIYTSDDLVGVEIGGALKNVIALGAGITDGLGYGDNIKAGMIARGMIEIARLGVKLGAKFETFAGLSGVGDLIVTCNSLHSRNYRCGMMLGKGIKASEAIMEIGMVVEGIHTVKAAHELSQSLDVKMPITDAIYRIICEEITAETAIDELMSREMKPEIIL